MRRTRGPAQRPATASRCLRSRSSPLPYSSRMLVGKAAARCRTAALSRIYRTRSLSTNRCVDDDKLDDYSRWAAVHDKQLREWQYEAPSVAAGLLAADSCVTPRSSAQILDVGCGTGLCGEAARAAGFGTVLGVDESPVSIAHLERIKPGLYDEVVATDIDCEPLPFPADSFDGVLCVSVLSYVSSYTSIFSEWARVTRPGGLVVFTHRAWLWVRRPTSFESARASKPQCERA